MEKINWTQVITQSIIILVPLIISGICYLKKKFNKIDSMDNKIEELDNKLENKIEELDNKLENKIEGLLKIISGPINRRMGVVLTLYSSLLLAFTKKGLLTREEIVSLTGELIKEIAERDLSQFVDLLRKSNPLSREDISALKKFIEKGRRGERFTSEEADKFYELAKILKEEAPITSWEAQDIWIMAQLVKHLTDFLINKGWHNEKSKKE